MPEDRYNVVFRGEIAEGWDVSKVKRGLIDRLGMTPTAADRFFSSPSVIIRKDVDQQSAARYIQVFSSLGAICHREAVPAGGSQSAIASISWQGEENGSRTAGEPSTPLVCPKCGHSQPPSEECSRCGLIFSRYRPSPGPPQGSPTTRPSITFYDLARERQQFLLLAVLLVVLAGFLYHLATTRDIKHPPGVLVPSEPEQIIIRDPKPWRKEQRVVVPLAHFRLQARVLSTERYYFDNVADLSPIDLALGWGPMSDQQVLDRLDIGQGSRRFVVFPTGDQPPRSMNELMAHSANMHMLPANDEIKASLLSLRPGHIIELSGYLVGVQENGEWTWVSSLTRTDTGDGSCEIVWVERLSFR